MLCTGTTQHLEMEPRESGADGKGDFIIMPGVHAPKAYGSNLVCHAPVCICL